MAIQLMAAGSAPKKVKVDDNKHIEAKNDKKSMIINRLIYALIIAINMASCVIVGYLIHDYINDNRIQKIETNVAIYLDSIDLATALGDNIDTDQLQECWLTDSDYKSREFVIGGYNFVYNGDLDAVIYTNNDMNDKYHVSAGYVSLYNTSKQLNIAVYDKLINQQLYEDTISKGLLMTDNLGVKYYILDCIDNNENKYKSIVYPENNDFIITSYNNSEDNDYKLTINS